MKALATSWIILAFLVGFVSMGSVPPVSQSKLNLLMAGMGTNEVRAVLGNPSSVVVDSHGFQLWGYNRFSWRTFMLHFDVSGYLVSFETD